MLEFVEAGDDVCCTRWVFTPWQPPGAWHWARWARRAGWSHVFPPAFVSRHLAELTWIVAGPLAESLYVPPPPSNCGLNEKQIKALRRSLLVSASIAAGDAPLEEGEEADEGDKWNDLTVAFYKAALIVGKGPPPRAKVRALVGEAEKWAERILEHNKGAVLKLAKSLAMRQRHRMTGKQVVRLIGQPVDPTQ